MNAQKFGTDRWNETAICINWTWEALLATFHVNHTVLHTHTVIILTKRGCLVNDAGAGIIAHIFICNHLEGTSSTIWAIEEMEKWLIFPPNEFDTKKRL
mmetsp:Transcript_4756/g.14126  ORF Transcript_4756/g.14126 Transcript_4756/m.14126 type:complete len:99 (+) Transcript_4756:3054-3350(+)